MAVKKTKDPRGGRNNNRHKQQSVDMQNLSRKERRALAKQAAEEARMQAAEEYYELESQSDIDVLSLRKAKRYQRIGILAVIIAIIAFAVYFLAFQQGIVGQQTRCWTQQQTVEELAEQYLTVNGFSSYPAYIEDIPAFSSAQQDCPSGGSYTWNPVTGEYFCSVHGHYPETFNRPQSVTQSVVQSSPQNTTSS